MKEKTIGLWGVAALTISLLSIFLFVIPYLLKGFDVYLPLISLGAFKYLGIVIFLIAAPLCLYSIFFLTKRARGMPLSRPRGGTPPKFVTTGPYGYVRHPQQLGFFLMLLGVTVYLESISVLIYTIGGWILSHLHVVFVEEPSLIKNSARATGNTKKRYLDGFPDFAEPVKRTKFEAEK